MRKWASLYGRSDDIAKNADIAEQHKVSYKIFFFFTDNSKKKNFLNICTDKHFFFFFLQTKLMIPFELI